MIENYIYKNESKPELFCYENKKISLREYQKDLLFYWSGETTKAEYALFDKTPISGSQTFHTNGRFGTYSKICKKITFDARNLESLTDNLHISFWAGVNSLGGYSTHFLTKKGDWEKLPAGDYSITFQVSGEISRTVVLTLKEGSTFSTIKNKLSFELDPNLYLLEVDAEQTSTGNLAISGTVKGKTFKITDGLESNNLLDYLEVSEINYGSYPEQNSNLVALNWETGSFTLEHVKATEEGKTLSKIRMTIKEGEIEKVTSFPWNNNGVVLDHIEVDIDSSVAYVFLNGELLKTVLISPIVRNPSTTTLSFGSDISEYSFEELIIKSKLQNKENFIPPTSQLTKYNNTMPYIDFHFSGNKIFQESLTNLVANCSDNVDLVLNYDGVFYYYASGAWRTSDGSYNQSNDSYTFADYINEFTFTGKDNLFIRAYFVSDGDTPVWLEDLYFTLNSETIYGDEKTTPAILVGTVEHSEELIDLKDKTLTITTDQGTTNITFPSAMTINEVVEYIQQQYPEGIISVYKDKANRLVLISETKGDEAFIIVSGEASDILFGNNKTEKGENHERETIDDNYNKFIEDLKKYSSNDLIPIEIDDEQIKLYLKEALNIYKKYRSDDINTYHLKLKGNAKDGYEIPSIIEDWHDITDILFRPLFPIGFYTGTLDNDSEDVVALTMINTMCGKGTMDYGNFYGKGFQADYYISLMSLSGMDKILGSDPSWRVYNKRLYIFPNNISKYTTVTICYKAPIDPLEAMRDPYVIQYCYGKIRMAQGEIRSQYGSQLSTNSIQVQFNGDTMFERGKAALEEAVKGMKETQEPLGLIWG